MSGVQVGVRIRPFLPKIDGEDKLCIEMTDTQTIITDILDTQEEKKFTFDYSFWSHDGFNTLPNGYTEPVPGTGYKDQKYVFEKIGISVLDNAWQGFHTCLFAYGQTGSGKSHSMIGYGENKGIVPLACDEIFRRIDANTDPDETFQVVASMCEIYNEKVQDLMVEVKKRPNEGLKVRESKTLGVYVDGLSKHACSSYSDIDKVMSIGESHRSKGATLMNSESSRAHTVIMIEFRQVTKFQGKSAQKLSVINLIDLAGSEKSSQTGATGDRLKEGNMINLSLSTLGNVIKALVDKQNGKKSIVIPYRNSNLTRMLQNALGGNSKTYMICAVRPGAKYFDETVSTLKYADRAKQIKNKAIVNEDPQDKLIRELKAENEKLKSQLAAAGGPAQEIVKDNEEDKKAMAAMEEQLAANKRMMEEMEKSWEQKLEESRQQEEEAKKRQEEEEASRLAGTPHLVNLNEDPMLDRKVVYDIKDGEPLTAGRRAKGSSHKLQLGGTGIQPDHATFELTPEGVMLKPMSDKAMEHCIVNGKPMTSMDGILLKPNDRVSIGPSAVFLFKNKQKEDEASMPDTDEDPISFDFANEEVLNFQNQSDMKAKEEESRAIEEHNKKKMDELKAQLDAEKQAMEDALKKKEEELAEAQSHAQDETKLKALEEQIEKERSAKEAFEKANMKKVMEEGLRQQQLTAEYNRVEKQLNQILPMVNEANLAATELKRDIKFNTKLVKKMDPFLKAGALSQGPTDVLIKVDNNEEKYFYEWPAEKFQNRIFMIREILDQYFDTGDVPKLDRNEDPFWDPPNPILIGQSYLSLGALGFVVESELDAAILSIDGTAGKNGTIKVRYEPCDAEGRPFSQEEDNPDPEKYADMPDELFVENDANELLQYTNEFYFKVGVEHAMQLPAALSKNAFVTYQFKFDKGQIYQTPEVNAKGKTHKWGFEKVHCIDKITPNIIQELKEGSISFQVYAYPPSNIAMPEDDGGKAIKRRMTMRGGPGLDAAAEAQVLGLKDDVNATAADEKPKPSPGPGASVKNNLKRKETLSKTGKLEQQQVVGISKDGTAVTEAQPTKTETDKSASGTGAKGEKVQAVGKEGSACCSIF